MLLRSGEATINNCKMISSQASTTYSSPYSDDSWGSDGNVPSATLVIGNCGTSASTYADANIRCVIKNTEITNNASNDACIIFIGKCDDSNIVEFKIDGESVSTNNTTIKTNSN